VLLFALLSCGQKPAGYKPNPVAVRLNNRAIALSLYINNKDSASKALILLDSATAIDSNYFLGYYNKLMFLNQLKEYDQAIAAVKNLVRLNPGMNDIYLTGGILFEKTGDTVSSRDYFEKSLRICNAVLDTMSVKNRNYDLLVTNKALALIMLGEQARGNLLLKQLYMNETDSLQKELTSSFMNKSKNEIINMVTNPQAQDSVISEPVEAK
jgi:tetratricopeptide (TPR) repeat protein